MQNYQEHARRLLNPDELKPTGAPLVTSRKGREIQLRLASDVKERIELVHTSQYSPFLQSFFPVFEQLIISKEYGIPPEMANGPNHKVRNVVMEILNRLPNNDMLKQYVPRLMKISMAVLENDNEENALIALKIICDLHRNFRPLLDDTVQQLIDFVRTAYERLERTVSIAFNTSSATPMSTNIAKTSILKPTQSAHAQSSAPHMESSQHHRQQAITGGNVGRPETTVEAIPASLASFKVLAECPVTVMLLFQMHSAYIQRNIRQLVSIMDRALSLRAPPQFRNFGAQGQKTFQQRRQNEHPRFTDFVGCQVKTLSFLTYLLRTAPYVVLMKQYEHNITSNVVGLLKECPVNAILTRKELLVATRHILATDFRAGFFKHINVLLDERVLMGPIANSTTQASDNDKAIGLQATIPPRESSLVPLAYSTLANLVHHFRAELTISQLSRVIYLFSRVVHDQTLPLSIQTTAVRLLLNLVDNIYVNQDPVVSNGKLLLLRVLDVLVRKLGTLRGRIPQVIELEKLRTKEAERELEMPSVSPMAWYYYAPPKQLSIPSAPSVDKDKLSAVEVTESNGTSGSNANMRQEPQKNSPVSKDSSQDVTKTGDSAGQKGTTNDDANNPVPGDKTVADEGNAETETKSQEKAAQVEVIKVTVENGGHITAFQGIECGVQPSHRDAFHHVHRTSLTSEEREQVRARVLDIGNPAHNFLTHGSNNSSGSSSKSMDTLADLKVLLKIMIIGLKTVVWCVANYDSEHRQETSGNPQMRGSHSSNLNTSMEEGVLLMKLVRWGMQCLPMFRPGVLPSCEATKNNSAAEDSAERKEKELLKEAHDERSVLEQFAGIFTVLNSHVFSDLMEANMEFMYANMLEHRSLVVVANALLKSSSVGRAYATVLFRFLTHRLHLLSGLQGPAPLAFEPYFESREFDIMPRSCLGSSVTSGAAITLLPGTAAGELDPLSNTTVSFDRVPVRGPHAAHSSVGLGLKPDRFSKEQVEEWKLNSARKAKPQVQAALIGQLMEVLLKNTAMFSKKLTNPGMVALYHTYFEHLVVSCLNRAAEMTSSSQAIWTFQSSPELASKVPTELHHGKDCYLLLLRTVFRAVTVSKALQESVQRTLDSLLLPIFRSLLRLLNQALDADTLGVDNRSRAHLIAEIALLVSLRVPKQILVDFLPMFREPIIVALLAEDHGNSDLASFAMRTLDTWVEIVPVALILKGLTSAKFAEASNLPSLKLALCRLLRPEPSPHGAFALKLLGKLGSPIRNPSDGSSFEGASQREAVVIASESLGETGPVHCGGLQVEMTWSLGKHRLHSSSVENELNLELNAILDQVVSYLSDVHVATATQLPRNAYSLNEDGSIEAATAASNGMIGHKRSIATSRRFGTHNKVSPSQASSSLGTKPLESGTNAGNATSTGRGAWDVCDSDKSLTHYKSQGIRFLMACLAHVLSSTEKRQGTNTVDVPAGAEAVPKEISLDFLLTVGAVTPEQVLDQEKADATSSRGMESSEEPGKRNRKLKVKPSPPSNTRALKLILRGLLIAASDRDVQREALVKLHSLVRHLALVAATNTVQHKSHIAIDSLESLEGQSSASTVFTAFGGPLRQRCWSIDSGSASQPDGAATSQVSGQGNHGGSVLEEDVPVTGTGVQFRDTVQVQALNDVVCNFLATSSSQNTHVALDVVDTLVSTFVSYYQSDSTKMAVYSQPFFNDLRGKLEQLCFHSSWWSKLGGCLGLRALLSRMPVKWTRAHWQSQLSALTFVIESHSVECGFAVLHAAADTLHALILKCIPLAQKESESTAKFVKANVRYTTETLLNALLSPFAQSRVIVRGAIKAIAEHMNLTVSKVLEMGDVGEQFCKSLFAIPLRMRSPDGQIAVLEALGFLLRLNPCPVRLFPTLPSSRKSAVAAQATEPAKQGGGETSTLPAASTASGAPGSTSNTSATAKTPSLVTNATYTKVGASSLGNQVLTNSATSQSAGNQQSTSSTTNAPAGSVTGPSASAKPIAVPVTTSKPIAVPVTTSKPIAVPVTTSKPIAVPVTTSKPIAVPATTSKPIAVPITTSKPIAVPMTTSKPIAVPMTASKPIAVPMTTSKPIAVPANATQRMKTITDNKQLPHQGAHPGTPSRAKGSQSSPAPTGDELEGLERNLVKLLAEAMLLTEAMNPDLAFASPATHAAIASGDLHPGSFLTTNNVTQRANQSSRTLFSGLSVKGGLRGTTYPFQQLPHPVALRKRCVEVALALMKHGGPNLMLYFSRQPTWMQLHHRMLSLFFLSLTSPWRCIAVVGDAAMPLVKEYAIMEVPPSQDAPAKSLGGSSAAARAGQPPGGTNRAPIAVQQKGPGWNQAKQHIISSDALGKCLRPVIQKIGEARYMSLAFLRSLPVLLSLFSDQFLGEKLWNRLHQYLNQWLDPDKILRLTCTQVAQDRKVNDALSIPSNSILRQYRPTWQSGEEVMIASSIMQVLHMGPKEIIEPAVSQLIQSTIQLEECFPKYQHRTGFARDATSATPSSQSALDGSTSEHWTLLLTQQMGNVYGRLSSPLRRPLVRLLNRYPNRALSFFLSEDRLSRAPYVQLLCEILNAKEAVALRRHLTSEPVSAEFIRIAFLPASDAERQQSHSQQSSLNHVQRLELQAQGVRIVRIMSKWCPDWLLKNKLVETLLAIWGSKTRTFQLAMEEHLTTHYRLVSKRICKILIAYFRYAQSFEKHLHQCVHVVYAMLTVLTIRTDMDYSFLHHFYANDIAKHAPLSVRRLAVSYYAKKFQSNNNPQLKEVCLRVLVLPVLSHAFRDPSIQNSDVIPFPVMKVIVESMLRNGVVHGATSSSVAEALQVQSLQLTTLLICHCGRELMSFRKELVKFSGNHLKSDDSTSRQWAYVSISTFFDVYATPPEIILQVYVALLKSYHSHARDLVRKALDILTPALPRRLNQQKYVKAIKWTKKLVFDEGHHNAQLIHIWQLLVRHPQLFYQHRNLVIPQIVNSLNRLGLQHNCPLENRKAVIDLVELVLSWERTRYVESNRARAESGELVPHKTGGETSAPSANAADAGSSSFAQVSGSLKRRVAVGDLGIPTLSSASSTFQNFKKASKLPKSTGGDVSIARKDQHIENPDDPFVLAAKMAANDAMTGFRANSTMVSMIAHFLLRVVLALAENKEAMAVILSKRAKRLFVECLVHGQRLCTEQEFDAKRLKVSPTINASEGASSNATSTPSRTETDAPKNLARNLEKFKVRIKFGYIAKYIGLLDQKQRSKALQREQVAKSRLQSAGPSSLDAELAKPLKVESPASMTCCIELMVSLLRSHRDTVALPFIQDNGPDLFICIDPVFRSKERGVKRLFGHFVKELLQLHPLDAKPAPHNQGLVGVKRLLPPDASKPEKPSKSDAKDKSGKGDKSGSNQEKEKPNNEQKQEAETTSNTQPAPLPKILGISTGVHWKPFYPTLLQTINKKLNFFADGLKGFEVVDAARIAVEKANAAAKAAASGATTGEDQPAQATAASTGTKKAAKKTKTKGTKGKKKETTKSKGKRKSSGASGTKATAAKSLAQSKAAVKARFEREADRLGAGPTGTLSTLHLVYQICGGDSETVSLAGADVALATPSAVDWFAESLMKVANKLMKDVLVDVATRSRAASSKSSGGTGASDQSGRTRSTDMYESNSADQRGVVGLPGTGLATANKTSMKANDTKLDFELDAVSHDDQAEMASRSLRIVLLILSQRVLSLEVHRKPFVHIVSSLLEKLDLHEADLLSTVVKIAGQWLLAPSATSLSHNKQSTKNTAKRNAVLASKERTSLMSKLTLVERFAESPTTERLMKQYRDVVLRVSSLSGNSAPQWVTQQAVQHAFTAGLLSHDVVQRQRYLEHLATRFYSGKGPFARLRLIAKQDWSPLKSTYWIPVALSMLTSAVNRSAECEVSDSSARVKGLVLGNWTIVGTKQDRPSATPDSSSREESISGTVTLASLLKSDAKFMTELQSLKRSDSVLNPLQELSFGDGSGAIAHACWNELFKGAWEVLEEQQKMTMTQGLHVLLSRGYHRTHADTQAELIRHSFQESSAMLEKLRQSALGAAAASRGDWDPYRGDVCVAGTGERLRRWRRQRLWSTLNVVQSLLTGIERCDPLPVIAPELLQHLGEHFGSSCIVIHQGESVLSQLSGLAEEDQHSSDTEARWGPVLYALYGAMGMREAQRGLLKACSVAPATHAALAFEAVGQWKEAQLLYEEAMGRTRAGNGRYALVGTRGGQSQDLPVLAQNRSGATSPAPTGLFSPQPPAEGRPDVHALDFGGEAATLPPGGMELGLLPEAGLGDPGGQGLGPIPLMPLDPYDPLSGLDMDNLFDEFPLDGTDTLMLEDELNAANPTGSVQRPSLPVLELSEMETASWESGWVECARQLNQWEEICELGRSCSDAMLYLEGASYSQSPDLSTVRDLFRTHSITAALDQGKLEVALQQVFLGIQEEQRSASSLGDLEMMWWQTANAYLERCVCASQVLGGESGHLGVVQLAQDTQMLSSFQQLVELDESIKTLSEVPTAVARYLSASIGGVDHTKRTHIMQQLISRWRKRVPGKHENMLMWNRIMSWRSHFFDVLESNVSSTVTTILEGKGFTSSDGDSLASMAEAKSQELVASVADRDWTLLCAASAARKLNNVDLCIHFLGRVGMNEVYQDENLTFMKLREELLLCQNQVALEETLTSIRRNTTGTHPRLRPALDVVSDLEKLLLNGAEGFFKVRHMGELLRLKAATLADTLAPTTQERREVISMITRAARMSVDDNKIWLEWGMFSDRMLQEVEGRANKSGETSSWFVNDWTEQQEGVLASRIADCFLQGSALGCQQSRLMLSRVLSLLRRENADFNGINLTPQASQTSSTGPAGAARNMNPIGSRGHAPSPSGMRVTRDTRPVAQSISRHSEVVPTWVWLPWIPQMITSLSMGEVKVARNLLGGLARDYPQVVYYSLRSQLSADGARAARMGADASTGKRRAVGAESPMAKRVAAHSPLGKTPVAAPVDAPPTPGHAAVSPKKTGSPVTSPLGAAEELIAYLRRQHPDFGREVEVMLEKVVSRFQCTVTEELYGKIARIHETVMDSLMASAGKENLPVTEAVVEMLSQTQKKFFEAKSTSSSYERFQRRYSSSFMTDFVSVDGKKVELTMHTVLRRLKRWKQVLWNDVSQKPQVESTHVYSRSLAKFQPRMVQIPGQYDLTDGFELPRVADHALMKNIEPFVRTFRGRDGSVQRRLSFRSYEGHLVHYLVQSVSHHLTHTDQRMSQLYCVLNTLLSREGVSASGGLRISVPVVVPLTSEMRLQKLDDGMLSLAYHPKLAPQGPGRHGEPPTEGAALAGEDRDTINEALLSFASAPPRGGGSDGCLGRLKALNEVTQSVSPTLLRGHVMRSSDSHLAFVSFRSTFAKQYALSCLLRYLLGTAHQAPQSSKVALRSGVVQDVLNRPGFSPSGRVVDLDREGFSGDDPPGARLVVPFRLTRNLQELMGAPTLIGQFPSSLRCAATGLVSKQNHSALNAYLLLFMRDQLASWNACLPISEQPGWYPEPAVPRGEERLGREIVCNQSKQMYCAVEDNTDRVLQKLVSVSGIGVGLSASTSSAQDETLLNPEEHVNSLVEMASDPSRLSLMAPSWQAWY